MLLLLLLLEVLVVGGEKLKHCGLEVFQSACTAGPSRVKSFLNQSWTGCLVSIHWVCAVQSYWAAIRFPRVSFKRIDRQTNPSVNPPCWRVSLVSQHGTDWADTRTIRALIDAAQARSSRPALKFSLHAVTIFSAGLAGCCWFCRTYSVALLRLSEVVSPWRDWKK